MWDGDKDEEEVWDYFSLNHSRRTPDQSLKNKYYCIKTNISYIQINNVFIVVFIFV